MNVIFQGNGGSSGGIVPSGKKTLTDLQETNVSDYATAQVDGTNISAENIKKDVQILGVTGSYEPAIEEAKYQVANFAFGEYYLDSIDINTTPGYNGMAKVVIQREQNTIPENIKNNVSVSGVKGTYGSDATASNMDIAYGKTAYGPDGEIQGILIDNRGSVLTTMGVTANNDYVTLVPQDGEDIIVDGQLGMKASSAAVANAAGLTPDIIKFGTTVLGVTGTYAPAPFTMTIAGTGDASFCYVIDNSDPESPTQYYTDGDTFTLTAGTTFTCYVSNMSTRVTLNGVSQTLDGGYCEIMPTENCLITMTCVIPGESYIDITYV